ncbi:MAG: response regulator [Desulfomonile tiedjei]|nr:response regulator [Desulfomonile tiedjei]
MPSLNKILVVDDDSISLKAIDHLLKSFGYSTVTASSGPEALEKLAPDTRMVLLDVMMPDMDGLEVTRRIREHPEYGDIPIIMVTALTRREDRLAAVQAGANDFVSKPLDRVELEIRIASHLKLKEAQDKRRESDVRYRILVENSPVGILCCNPLGEVTEINAAASDLFGIPSSGSAGPQNLFEKPELSASGISDFLRSCLESDEMVVNEFALGMQEDRFARLYVVPVRDREGLVSGLQVVSEDISDQKRMQELSRRGTRLRAFAEMARGSVRHFSDALENIGKQVTVGLTAIDAQAYTDVRTSLEGIRVDGQRASQTLHLLDKFSRGYSKRDAPTWAAFDFSEAVREALEVTEPSWKVEPPKKGIEIELESSFVEECYVEGERSDVVEIAAHLIRNAAEAMQRGGTLVVKTFSQDDHAVLEVQDEGLGMTQEQLKKVGYPFWTSKQSHAGLGLAVSCGIIRRHFGTFSISSKRGRGTTFTVKLPLTARRKEDLQDRTLEILAANPKTLFFDPDEGIKGKFSSELQGRGPVYFARSVEEAVKVVHEKNIDAIVCSEALPTAAIVEFSKRVSIFGASKGTVRPPFIMLAQGERLALPVHGLSEAYINRVVEKSIDLGQLMQIVGDEVRSALSRPRIAGTLGQIDVLDVVQMMLLSGQSLVLEVMSQEGRRGLLYISNGEVCHAKCGSLEGEEALYWALGLRSGFFSTLAWVAPERTTIDRPGQMLLVEAARRRDELSGPPDDEPEASI